MHNAVSLASHRLLTPRQMVASCLPSRRCRAVAVLCGEVAPSGYMPFSWGVRIGLSAPAVLRRARRCGAHRGRIHGVVQPATTTSVLGTSLCPRLPSPHRPSSRCIDSRTPARHLLASISRWLWRCKNLASRTGNSSHQLAMNCGAVSVELFVIKPSAGRSRSSTEKSLAPGMGCLPV